MSKFPKSARHPNISSLVDKWSNAGASVNLTDESRLSEFPELARLVGNVRDVQDLDYFGAAREVVGANAIRALAKGYEALDASSKCGEGGVVMGAMVHAYNASYFAARAFCMLMGFAPLDRGSNITLDVFSEETVRTQKTIRSIDVLRLHKFERWGHEEVWQLTRRLVDTMKVPTALEETKETLRTIRMDKSSRIRNAFQYDDSILSVPDIRTFADFPNRVELDVWEESVPHSVRHSFLIAKNLMSICSMVIEEGNMDHLLFLCIAKGRLKSLGGWGKWA